MRTNLLQVSIFYLMNTSWLSLLTVHAVLGFIDFMTWKALSNGYSPFKLLCLFCLQKYTGRWKSMFQYNCSQGVKNMFIRTSWIRYIVEMPYSEQSRYRIADFSNRMEKAAEAIHMIVDWGIPTGIALFRTTLLMLVIGSGEGGKECIFLMVSISVGMYFFRFSVKEQEFREDHKKFRDLLLRDRRMIAHQQALLPSENSRIVELFRIIKHRNTRQRESWEKWRALIDEVTVLKIVNYIVLLISYRHKDFAITLIIYTLFRRFSRALSTMMEFAHAAQRSQADFDEWTVLWKNLEVRAKRSPKKIPGSITIEKVDFSRGNFSLTLENKFEVKQGSTVLVRGESGAGKTTFFELLRGRLSGLKLGEGEPVDYGSEYCAYTAQTREIPVVDISLREICKPLSRYHIGLINQCLKICELEKWMVDRGLDRPINAETSSGEKNRLLLALIVLYPLLLDKKPVLILDELENGLDPPLAYKILENILNLAKIQNITMYVSSHLEHINKFSWNTTLCIQDGRINNLSFS